MLCESGVVREVGDAYDEQAELYASLFLHELRNDEQSLQMLDRLAALVPDGAPVLDVGCGPGGLVQHLVELGLDASGIDLSPGQIAQARAAFPECRFEVGNLTDLQVDDGSLGGITSKYSIIHLDPGRLADTFAEWRRALSPGAPLFLSFFGSRSAEAHGTPFDHKVVTAHELCPTTVSSLLDAAGFVDVETTATPIPPGGRPFDHVTMLARAAAG